MLFFLYLVLATIGCNFDRQVEPEHQLFSFATALPTATPVQNGLDVAIVERKPLSRSQRKTLERSLPLQVRVILERSPILEVLGLSSSSKAGMAWSPDISVPLPPGAERAELLDSFYFDASAGPNTSACFIPRHGLRATYKGKSVEIIICYECHLFEVKGDLGEYHGGVYLNGSAAHHRFDDVLRDKRATTNGNR
jgi:hypothetical protein